MNELLKPVVALEKISLDHLNFRDTLRVKSLNCSNDTHILYVNGTHPKSSSGPANTDDRVERLCTENFDHENCSSRDEFLKNKRSSLKEKKDVDSASKKRVSFSNQSKVLYFSKDQVASEVSKLGMSYMNQFPDSIGKNNEINYVAELTTSEPPVEPFNCLSAADQNKHAELISDNEQPILFKDLVITLEKLPKHLLKEVKSENYVPKECSYNSTSHAENQDIDECSDSQFNESPDKTLAVNFENMLNDEKQELQSDVQGSHRYSSDLLLEENIHPLPELKVCLQRLPDNLLELHLNHCKSQNSDEVIFLESKNCSIKAVSFEDQQEKAELNSSAPEAMLHNAEKGFSDYDRLLPEKENSSNHIVCDISVKKPYVLLERLNLVIPNVEYVQQTNSPIEGEGVEENVFFDGLDNSISTKHKVPRPIKDSSRKVLKAVQTASKINKSLLSGQLNTFFLSEKKHKSSSHQTKTSIVKFLLQKENGTSVTEVSDNCLPSELTEMISLDSQNVSSALNSEIQCNLSLPKDKFVSNIGSDHCSLPSLQLAENDMNTSCFSSNEHIEFESSNQENICWSDEEELPLSCISNRKISETYTAAEYPGYLSDNSSFEDDIPLSQLCEPNNMKQSKIITSSKKKLKKRPCRNELSIAHNNEFTDFNVLHMTEMIHQHPLSLKSNVKRKSQKGFTSQTSRIKKSHSKNKIILFSPMTGVSNPDPLLSEIRKASLLSEVKKAPQTPTSLKKRQKPIAKKYMPSKEIILLPHLTKINYVNTSALIGKKVQVPSCENNSASDLKNISTDHCYCGPLLEKTIDKRNIFPEKTVKLDHNYDISCNTYSAKQNKFTNQIQKDVSSGTSSVISKLKTSKGTRKKKKGNHCKGKRNKSLDDPDVFLKMYLKKFCSDFDELGSKKSGSSLSASTSSHQKKRTKKDAARKRKENAYQIIINKLQDHLNRTCSIRKSVKRQKKRENSSLNINERSPVQIPGSSFEYENNCSAQPSHFHVTQLSEGGKHVLKESPQPTKSKRKFTARKHLKGKGKSKVDNYRLGFLTKNQSLRLYNKCLVSERLLLSKYKMKKEQRKKLKQLFHSLKNNSLDKKEL